MARLILEEGETRRAFKVGEGRLTIGSGPSCALRLTSPNVAELHAELEITGGVAYLRPRPGVMPPLMHGQPVTHQTPLGDDVRFEIGAARFHFLASDTGAVPAPSAASPKGSAPVRPGKPAQQPKPVVKPGARAAKPQPKQIVAPKSAAARGDGAEGASVQRTRARVKIEKGMPTWVLLCLIGGGLVIAVFVVKGMLGGTGETTVIPEATLARAQQRFESREFEASRSALALIDRTKVSEGLRRQIEALEQKMDTIDNAAATSSEHEREANDYRTTQLENFMKKRLLGDNPPRERVRVFLKRLREFRERWPEYPEMDWIDRHERLYSRLADLSEPPTLKDVAYEVETLTWAKPRYYGQAAGLLRKFIETASSSDREAAVTLLDELARAEEVHFIDQMQQAKYHYERKETGKCVGVLIALVVDLDNPEFRDEAAQEFVQLPGFDQFLRGYRTTNPRRYEDLIQHPRMREAAQRAGLI